MAENIGGENLFGSGGHVWQWSPSAVADKRLATIGTRGAARMVTQIGPAPCRIVGRDGGPALLKATGTSRDEAATALEALVVAIQEAMEDGTEQAWEDDLGWNGESLVVTDFRRVGCVQFGCDGAGWHAWQYYTADLLDLAGGGDS